MISCKTRTQKVVMCFVLHTQHIILCCRCHKKVVRQAKIGDPRYFAIAYYVFNMLDNYFIKLLELFSVGGSM